MINKRTFHTQACHFTDKNDKVGNFLESQAKIQDQAQEKSAGQVTDNRREYGKHKVNELVEDYIKLDASLDSDRSLVHFLTQKREEKEDRVLDRVDNVVNSVYVTEESRDEMERVEDKYNQLRDILRESIETPSDYADTENVEREYQERAMNLLSANENRSKLDILSSDPLSTEQRRSVCNDLRAEINELDKDNVLISEWRVEMAKKLRDSYNTVDNCAKDYDTPNPLALGPSTPDPSTPDTSTADPSMANPSMADTSPANPSMADTSPANPSTADPNSQRQSLIDDFADVSTEMPSYMDPED